MRPNAPAGNLRLPILVPAENRVGNDLGRHELFALIVDGCRVMITRFRMI